MPSPRKSPTCHGLSPIFSSKPALYPHVFGPEAKASGPSLLPQNERRPQRGLQPSEGGDCAACWQREGGEVSKFFEVPDAAYCVCLAGMVNARNIGISRVWEIAYCARHSDRTSDYTARFYVSVLPPDPSAHCVNMITAKAYFVQHVCDLLFLRFLYFDYIQTLFDNQLIYCINFIDNCKKSLYILYVFPGFIL